MKKPHEDWFWFAKEDLRFAKAGLNDDFYPHVCFLAQQAVEKAMKGFLVAKGKDYPKSHDLIKLRRLMGVDWLDSHLQAVKALSEVYIPLRYPDAMAGTLPEGLPDKKDAKEFYQWAEEIVALIESHL